MLDDRLAEAVAGAETLRRAFLDAAAGAVERAAVSDADGNAVTEEDLPGSEGHGAGGQTLKAAAVLIPVVVRGAELSVLFTRRTDHLHHHPGQVSFPGGRVEPTDLSPVMTALRETEEEIGLDPDRVELLGELPDYVTGTGFCVRPVVGLVHPPFELALDAFEVAEAFEVPLSFLMDPANHQRRSKEFLGRQRHFYAMPYGDYYIWGVTAGILMSLYRFLRGA